MSHKVKAAPTDPSPFAPHLEMVVREEDQSSHTDMQQAQDEQPNGAQHCHRQLVCTTLWGQRAGYSVHRGT